MEVKKPIKRNPAIVDFSKDHHFSLLLVWKIREGLKKEVSAERISKYIIHFFDIDLVHHFAEEEQLLFSKMPVDNPLRIQVEQEHTEVYQMIAQFRNETVDYDFLHKFADFLDKHIRFEERELFNYLQEYLTEAQLAEIAASVKPRAHVADDNWDDIFWKINP